MSTDSIERIVAELREYAPAMPMFPLSELADRLEKLSAASVQVTDIQIKAAGDVLNRELGMMCEGDAGCWLNDSKIQEALEAALRLSPQGEDHGR